MRTLSEWQTEVHRVALDHGWWENERPIPEMLCLIHSELSEALEEYRKDRKISYEFIEELADVFIRLVDMCAGLNIDLDAAVFMKNEINKRRPYKHGKML